FVEIPPTGAIRHKVERSVRRPPRLEDRVSLAASDPPRLERHAFVGNVRDPELGAVPRHLRVAPSPPRQTRAIRTEAGGRGEIVTGRNNSSVGRRTVQAQAHKGGYSLTVWVGMIFAHTHQLRSCGVDRSVGVEAMARRCQRLRRASRLESIEA